MAQVAARLSSERPDSVIPVSKTFTVFPVTFIPTASVDVSGTDIRRLVAIVQEVLSNRLPLQPAPSEFAAIRLLEDQPRGLVVRASDY